MLGFFIVVFGAEIKSCAESYWWRDNPPTAAVAATLELAETYMGHLDAKITTLQTHDFGKFTNVKGQDIDGGGLLLSLLWADVSWKVYIASGSCETNAMIEEAIEFLIGTYQRLSKNHASKTISMDAELLLSPAVQLTENEQLLQDLEIQEAKANQQMADLVSEIQKLERAIRDKDAQQIAEGIKFAMPFNALKARCDEENHVAFEVFRPFSEAHFSIDETVKKMEANSVPPELREQLADALAKRDREDAIYAAVCAKNRKAVEDFSTAHQEAIRQLQDETTELNFQLRAIKQQQLKLDETLRKLKEQIQKVQENIAQGVKAAMAA